MLDIISIPMVRPQPKGCQTENHLIADQYYWRKLGTATWAQILQAVDTIAGPLWINGYSSSNGTNDRIPIAQAEKLDDSLVLVRPDYLKIRVAPKGDPNAPAKRSVRAEFSLNRHKYNLVVTDPVVERGYLQGKNGVFPVSDAILCISLGEPFGGHVYKLVAAIITPNCIGKNYD